MTTAARMGEVFVFFTNRLGCLGSVLVSLAGTAVLILILVLINGR